MAIYSQSQLVSASNATYTTNGAGGITGATVRALNVDWVSSSILAPMTSSMTVLSASYAGTASVLLGSIVSSSYALTASYAGTASVLLGSVVSASYAATASTVSVTATSTNVNYFLALASATGNGQQLQAGTGWALNPSTDFLIGNKLKVITTTELTGSTTVVGTLAITGSLNITGSAYGNVIPVTVSSNTASINLAAGNFFTVTLANSATTFFNVTNPLPGVSANLILTTGTVSSASFSSNVKQPSGSAYLPTSGSGQIDALSLIAVDSSNVYLVASKKFV
jgi:hypothetical protein